MDKYFTDDGVMGCNEPVSGNSSHKRRLDRCNSSSSISASLSVSLSDKYTIPQFSNFFYTNETDRLISNQGLTVPKERPSTSYRKVRDKNYYKGEIYSKGKKISDEIRKLQKEINLLQIDQSTYLPYKKKAELKAMELQNLQGTLANYNLVEDMLNNDVQLDEAKQELQKLRNENETENKDVEKLFDLTKQQEAIIKECETDLSQEKYVSEILTTTMNPPIREKYLKLKRMDEKYQSTRVDLEKDLQNLDKEKKRLENHCTQSKCMRDALKLLNTLRQSENQRDAILSEKKFHSVSDEGEYLQKYRHECSDILKGMAQENNDLENRIKDITEELKNAENETSNLYKERSEKYTKLKKREKIMDEFLSSSCKHQLAYSTERQNLEDKVAALLKDISSNLGYFNPTIEQETENNILNQNGLNMDEFKSQFLKLASEYEEINNLEEKLNDELMTLKNDIAEKENEIPIFSEIRIVKDKITKRERELLKELSEIKNQKLAWEFILKDLKIHLACLENKLNSNQTHVLLSELEKRWHLIEKENFSLNISIQSKNFENNYLPVKEQVKKVYLELNKMLKK